MSGRVHGAGDLLDPFADDMSLTSISSSLFTVKSHSTLIESEGYVPRTKLCLIGEVSSTLEAAAESFGLAVVRSETGLEYLDDPSVVLVVDDFTPDRIARLSKIKWRVFGSVFVIERANDELHLPIVRRPTFNSAMKGVVTCFTGIRDVNLATEVTFLIHSMGGSVRREPDSHTTHLISTTTKGKKYEYARIFIVPVMSVDWVRATWERRFQPVHATDDVLMAHRLKPFVDVTAAFVGFPALELEEMVRLLKTHGGQHVDATSPICSHIVADDISPVTIPSGAWSEANLVRAEWFWCSIQQVARADEAEFPIPEQRLRRPPQRGSVRGPRPDRGSVKRSNKENVDPSGPSPCRLRDLRSRRQSLASIAVRCGSPADSPNRTLTPGRGCRSPMTPDFLRNGLLDFNQAITPNSPCLPDTPELFAGRTLFQPSAPPVEILRGTSWGRRASTSSLPGTPTTQPRGSPRGRDSTTSPGRCKSGTPTAVRLSLGRKGSLDSVAAAPISSRFGAFLELMHTEENYVGILDAVLQMRSEALNPGQAGGVLLTQTEAKMIFGALMPIARTHHAILKDLRYVYNNWSERANIGEVFQRYCPELLRDYAPFVSSFEDAKETLQQASDRNPRFHAFLKVCRGKPECGRQELHELMIRPVQRLASCKLLLREILKHTPENSPDRKQLESAVDSLSHVLSLINEDKRKMESLCRVFDIYNLIDKCPADLIASHRSLVAECEGVEVSEHGFSKQGNHLAFFIFTDVILVCKKKSKVVAMMKGQPGSNIPHRVLKVVRGKPYKFLQMLPLSTIKKIVDVANSESVTNAMGLVFRGKTEIRESCSYFRLVGDTEKAVLIERWSCALASHNCVADPSKFVQRESAEEAGIQSTTEAFAKQINKAAQMAAKTQAVIVTSALGLGRTLSTMSKNGTTPSPPPHGACVMSTFNSTSRLQERREDSLFVEEERPKSSSLNANMMKRM